VGVLEQVTLGLVNKGLVAVGVDVFVLDLVFVGVTVTTKQLEPKAVGVLVLVPVKVAVLDLVTVLDGVVVGHDVTVWVGVLDLVGVKVAVCVGVLV